MYGRYFIDSYQLPAFYSPTNILLTTQSGNPEQRYQTITLGENYVISSTTVNSAHFTAVRRLNHRGYAPNDINANTLGITIYQIQPVGFFMNASAKTHGFNIGGDSNSLAVINDNIPFDVSDDLTLVRGRHQIVLVEGMLETNSISTTHIVATGSSTSTAPTAAVDLREDLPSVISIWISSKEP